MKKILFCIVMVFLFSSCARVKWTKTDKAMFGMAVTAQGYDFYTTNRAIDRGHGIRSDWQWLYGGDRPETSTLAASKAIQLGLAWIILDRTPSDLRKIILGIMTGGWIYYGSQNK